MVSNREIRRLLNLYSELLILHGKDEQQAKWLAGAAFNLRRVSDELAEMSKAQYSKQFRPAIAVIVKELLDTGTIQELDELIQLTPPGLFDMMRIKGLGGKKLKQLWQVAKIDTLEGLLKACKAKLISRIPAFGPKTETNILQAIEEHNSSTNRFHYAFVAEDAEALVSNLQKRLKTKLVSLCGEIRRQTTTVPGIELICAKKPTPAQLKGLIVISVNSKTAIKGHTLDEIPVDIHIVSPADFPKELLIRTGSELHIKN